MLKKIVPALDNVCRMDRRSFHSISGLFLVIDRIGATINTYRSAVQSGTEKRLFIFEVQKKASKQELDVILADLRELETRYQTAFAEAKEALILYMFEIYPALVEYPRLIGETISGLELHAKIYLRNNRQGSLASELESAQIKKESEDFLNVMDSCSELGELLYRSFQNNDRQYVSLS